MKAKNKVILGSALAIAMSASMIAGTTFALFTSESSVNIAITSAKVSISAEIEKGESKSTLGGAAIGTLDDSVPGKIALENIAPGDEFSFTVTTTNTSSIAILYRTAIAVEGDLAPALEVTIGEATYSNLKSYTDAWAKLEAEQGPEQGLAITVAFPALEESQNEYMELGATISVAVEGVQANAGYEVGGVPTVDFYTSAAMNEFDFEFTGDSYVISGLADAAVTEVTIPATENGFPVVLEEGAFSGNKTIEKVTINCASIPSEAFKGCTSLKEVVLEEGVEELGYQAFGCAEKYVGGGNYEPGEGNKLETVVIPDSVTTIKQQAFYFSPVKEVIFGANSQLKEIEDHAFEYSGLEKIVLPESLEKIGAGAFSNCQLEEIVVPAGVKALEYNAFVGCYDLAKVTLPATLETIGSDVFSCCKLQEINFVGTQAEFEAVMALIKENAKNSGYTPLCYLISYDDSYLDGPVNVLLNGELAEKLYTSATPVTIDGETYTSLEGAMDAIAGQANVTLTLHANVTISKDFKNLPENLVIDANGNQIIDNNKGYRTWYGKNVEIRNAVFNGREAWGICTSGVNFIGCTFNGFSPYIVGTGVIEGCTFNNTILQFDGADYSKVTIKNNVFNVNNVDAGSHGIVFAGGTKAFWEGGAEGLVFEGNTFNAVNEDQTYLAYYIYVSDTVLLDSVPVFENNTYNDMACYTLNKPVEENPIPLNA